MTARFTRIERIREKGGDHTPPWLVTFTDLASLMLAYFILLFATTQVRNEAWIEASESMRSRFGGDESVTVLTGSAGEKSAERTWESTEGEPGLDVKYLQSLVKKRLSADPELAELEMHVTGDGVAIELPMSASFAPGSVTMSTQGQVLLKRLAIFLAQLPNAVEIIGHADKTLIGEDSFGSNWHLSLARAQSAAETLNRYGYTAPVAVRGRGAAESDLLPKNLPDDVRNERARRVEIRLNVLQP
jgi:chemotaxis protein MotB